MTILTAVIAILAAAGPVSTAPPEAPPCDQARKIDRVCGIPVPEDLIAIPDSSWIIVSSLPRDGSPGGLYLVDTKTRAVEAVEIGPERAVFASGEAEARAVGGCAPPDRTKLTTHGVSIVQGEGDVHRLYVVGHGARESIELFNIDLRSGSPIIAWAGCVSLPEGLEGNSVVGLEDGGFLFTSLFDRADADWSSRMAKLGSAAPSGGVYEWQPEVGITRRPTPALSGPNGIEVSQDGETIFLAGWGDRTVRRIDRDGNETAPAVQLGFLPDNLHWTPDGSLLAAGQRAQVAELFACTTQADAPDYCARSYSVARIDPETLAIVWNWDVDIPSGFGDSTSAIVVDGRLWLGSINGECLAVVEGRGK